MALLTPAAREAAALCADGLRRYKLRTTLSVVGVVAGVAAVVAMLAVAEGGRRRILAEIEALGVDNIVVRPHLANPEVTRRSAGITIADRVRLASLVPQAERISAVAQRYLTVSGPFSRDVSLVAGIEPEFAGVMDLRLARGRFVHTLDGGDRPKRVAVLGAALAARLFGKIDPIQQKVRIEREWYDVIGVLQRHPVSRIDADSPIVPLDLDSATLVPLESLLGGGQRFSLDRPLDEIWVQAVSVEGAAAAARSASKALDRLHSGLDDYEIVQPRLLLEQQLRTQRTFDIIVGSVAVLALIVGGIGIMNIMLAAVLERTPEIGLRRTVGATRRWVAAQFLAEATTMTLVGGTGGIVVGWMIAWAIARYAQWPVYVGAYSTLCALVVSLCVGVGFGAYPALRAARLQPIDAVRYE